MDWHCQEVQLRTNSPCKETFYIRLDEGSARTRCLREVGELVKSQIKWSALDYSSSVLSHWDQIQHVSTWKRNKSHDKLCEHCDIMILISTTRNENQCSYLLLGYAPEIMSCGPSSVLESQRPHVLHSSQVKISSRTFDQYKHLDSETLSLG